MFKFTEPNNDPPETFGDHMETLFISLLRGVLTSMGYKIKKIHSFKQRWCEIDESSMFDVQFTGWGQPNERTEIEIPLWQLLAFIYSSENITELNNKHFYTLTMAMDSVKWFNDNYSSQHGNRAVLNADDMPGKTLDKFINHLFTLAAGIDERSNYPTSMRHVCAWPTETKEGYETVDIIGRKCQIGGGCLTKCPFAFQAGHPGWDIMQKAALNREFPGEQF